LLDQRANFLGIKLPSKEMPTGKRSRRSLPPRTQIKTWEALKDRALENLLKELTKLRETVKVQEKEQKTATRCPNNSRILMFPPAMGKVN